MNSNSFRYQPGKYADNIKSSHESLEENRIIRRIWDHDHTVWKDDPAQITNRLGWLKSPETMRREVPRIEGTVQSVREDGYTDALLLGMGGSSLAPELLSKVFGVKPGHLDLRVLDSTDPAAVRAQAERLDPVRTLFIVSTKSGTTAETLSFFKYFYNITEKSVSADKAGDHFIAITDPGSTLESLASDLAFRDTYLNDPDIGGRYSALSLFGLVPGALIGVDIGLLLQRAAGMASGCRRSESTCAALGLLMGTLHNHGVDKLTLLTSPAISPLGAWLEQLLAESTGKQGRGILPVEGEIPGPTSVYGTDRIFASLCINGDHMYEEQLQAMEGEGHPVVRIVLDDLYDLGAEFFRWEFATAVAGHIMGINPFDQPNVESAKVQARRMLEEYMESGHLPAVQAALEENDIAVFTELEAGSPMEAVKAFLGQAGIGDYVAVQAYLDPARETSVELNRLRHRIRDRKNVATTLGYGPRYLHSTGQLHKGDGGNGLFIQITADDGEDLPIPDAPGKDTSSITFGVLKAAQALGDMEALKEAGRRVIRFHMKGDIVQSIRKLQEWVE